ncbi:type II toxin-antitoxin system RelE/ParE family toxin [Trichloromonas sp.]|uniref:type II toxin-antitoxin system RelE/ParE family toxin n=1 Tax=Trichloromonas sp. TaxID=3069249 RepID=UPI002A4C5848|nr:plasmid stabilization protein [Trichloromonas sp.]
MSRKGALAISPPPMSCWWRWTPTSRIHVHPTTPERFLRQTRKFFRKHPDLKTRFGEVFADLQNDPFRPRLGLHPLTGKLAGCHAVRLTYTYRPILMLFITEGEIVLLDIGSHDRVYC